MSIKWVEKYSPKTIEEFSLNSDQKELILDFINNQDIPDMLLSGKPGIGKSSLAKAIPSLIPDSVPLYINASDENGIDTVRNKIKQFVNAMSPGGIKILILDEADGLSAQAQQALRNTMEQDGNTKFILTCNFPEKIIDPLKSRCPEIHLSSNPSNIIKRCVNILQQENIKVDKDDVINIKNIVDDCYPDIRKVVNKLQRCWITGSYKPEKNETESCDKLIRAIIYKNQSFDQNKKLREYWLNNECEFNNDYSVLGSKLYNEVDKLSSDGKYVDILIEFSACLYQLDNVVDKEIQFHAMTLLLMGKINGKPNEN